MYKFEILVYAHKMKYSTEKLPFIFQNHLKINKNSHLRSKDNFQLLLRHCSTARKQSEYEMSLYWNEMLLLYYEFFILVYYKKELNTYLVSTLESYKCKYFCFHLIFWPV